MKILDLIEKKKHGLPLEAEEIGLLIEAYTQNEIPDYQMASLLMAIYFKGMNSLEIKALTKAMVESGDCFDLSDIKGKKVDKHSTGGVGDTTTLVLGPIIAACGHPFAKMSGKGLGHTGGTLDKLDSIPGFKYELDMDTFKAQANRIGIAIAGQTANITPADKKLYALRDATGSVDSIPLIASSIMSKKIAMDSNVLLLDVKVGEGAFMTSLKEAQKLAKVLVKLGHDFDRNTLAILTSMEEPLGNAIGNSLEVEEAIDTLKGNGPKDLYHLCLVLATKLIAETETIDETKARKKVEKVIANGSALDKFRELIEAQGGNSKIIDNYGLFPQAKFSLNLKSKESGYLVSLPAKEVGTIARNIGAGRITMEQTLNFGAGIVLEKKIGDKVEKEDILARFYGDNEDELYEGMKQFLEIIEFSPNKVEPPPLILGEVAYES